MYIVYIMKRPQTHLIALAAIDSDIGNDDIDRMRVEFGSKTILMMNDEIGYKNSNF